MTLDGSPLSFDAAPCIEEGRVLVPMRGVLEALGYSVQWQAETRTVLAEKGDVSISMPLDSPTVTVNQEAVSIDVPARLKAERTFVPLRFLAEYSGASVRWNGDYATVIIRSAPAEQTQPKDSVVYLQTNKMQGSGVVLSADGLIVTNYHVIEGASTLQFVFHDGQIYQGKTTVVGLNPQRDIALLQIEKNDLIPAAVSERYQIGDEVTAIGSPLGRRNLATEGVISGFDRDIISSTAVIEKGSSGGGLFNAGGKLIGITSSYGGGQYLAIPMTLVEQVPRDLSIPLAELKTYTYQPTAPQNPRCTREGNYAYVSWSPVYGASKYSVYTAPTKDGPYTKLTNTSLGSDTWYWGFPHAFGISVNPQSPYYLKVSATINGVETPLSKPLKIQK